jgi:hypothetical protein
MGDESWIYGYDSETIQFFIIYVPSQQPQGQPTATKQQS